MLKDFIPVESLEKTEINNLMSGESEKTPDILISESSDLVNKIKEESLKLESAINDLNSNNYDIDMLEKYEALTNESGIVNMIFDHWTEIGSNVIDRIINYIKKIYSTIILYLKKLYIKFLVRFKSYSDDAKELVNTDLNIDSTMLQHFSYFSKNNKIDDNLKPYILESYLLKTMVNKFLEINKVIAVTIPKKEVYTDYDSQSNGILKDIIETYIKSINSAFNTEFIVKNNNDFYNMLNNNIADVPEYKKHNLSYIVLANSKDVNYVSIDDKGRLVLKALSRKMNPNTNVDYNTFFNTMLNDITKLDIKSVIENDFRLLDTIKKDADAYLNLTKRYAYIDAYGVNIYASNISFILNYILNYSLMRIDMLDTFMKTIK